MREYQKQILQWMEKGKEERTAPAQKYAEAVLLTVARNPEVTPKVFRLACDRTGCRNFVDLKELELLFNELNTFLSQCRHGLPMLAKEADDPERIKAARVATRKRLKQCQSVEIAEKKTASLHTL